MQDVAVALIVLGALFLLGLLTDLLGRRTPLPRVTLLLVFGFAIGPSGLDLLPPAGQRWFPFVSDLALVVIGFLLGGHLTVRAMRRHGRMILGVSLTVVLGTAVIITTGMLLGGVSLVLALIAAGLATATDPAATVDVTNEMDARGEFTETLLGIVALDDAWGLILFSVLLALAEAIHGGASPTGTLLAGAWELVGAVGLGILTGVPMAFLSGRIRDGEPTQVEALGMVLLCGGLALYLGVSFLLACMVMGTVVANVARHHKRPFHAIEGIEWPFMVLFFVLSGARLDVQALATVGGLGAAYVALRVLGRLVSGWVGCRLVRANRLHGRWMGAALFPQAGVALGMALVAADRLPYLADRLMALVIGTTVLFEVLGPIVTRLALVRVGEAGSARETQGAPARDG